MTQTADDELVFPEVTVPANGEALLQSRKYLVQITVRNPTNVDRRVAAKLVGPRVSSSTRAHHVSA